MDRDRFTDNATGTLTKVTIDGSPDWAFTPAPLPPANWEFPASLWPLLAEAREQLVRLDERGRSFANPSLLMRPLQKREAVHSSAIEGTYATAKDLLLFEMAPKEARDTASVAEVSRYDMALRFGAQNLEHPDRPDTLPLSRRLITEMHKILMQGARGSVGTPGEFRRHLVYIGSNRRYVPPPPGDAMLNAINDLERYVTSGTDRFNPLVLAYLVHYQFEAIHPFPDGNGRTGRLLLALTTYKWCGLQLPWLYMSAYFDRFKEEYIDNLFRVSTHGDWERWIAFCLRGTIVQANDGIRRCAALTRLMRQMKDQLGHLPRMLKIIDNLFFDPVFTAAHIAKWTNSTLPTARRDIDELVKSGHVEHLEGNRPRIYFVPQIFSVAYGERETSESDAASDAESSPNQQ